MKFAVIRTVEVLKTCFDVYLITGQYLILFKLLKVVIIICRMWSSQYIYCRQQLYRSHSIFLDDIPTWINVIHSKYFHSTSNSKHKCKPTSRALVVNTIISVMKQDARKPYQNSTTTFFGFLPTPVTTTTDKLYSHRLLIHLKQKTLHLSH